MRTLFHSFPVFISGRDICFTGKYLCQKKAVKVKQVDDFFFLLFRPLQVKCENQPIVNNPAHLVRVKLREKGLRNEQHTRQQHDDIN